MPAELVSQMLQAFSHLDEMYYRVVKLTLGNASAVKIGAMMKQTIIPEREGVGTIDPVQMQLLLLYVFWHAYTKGMIHGDIRNTIWWRRSTEGTSCYISDISRLK